MPLVSCCNVREVPYKPGITLLSGVGSSSCSEGVAAQMKESGSCPSIVAHIWHNKSTSNISMCLHNFMSLIFTWLYNFLWMVHCIAQLTDYAVALLADKPFQWQEYVFEHPRRCNVWIRYPALLQESNKQDTIKALMLPVSLQSRNTPKNQMWK